MAVIEVPDIGVKKGNQIYSMRDMMVKAQGALKSFGDGCGVKKGSNIYVIRSGALAGYDNVCQLKFVNDYIDGEIDSSIFSTFEGEFNDVKLHGNKILLSHNGGFVEYNAETKQVTKQFRPTGTHTPIDYTADRAPLFSWFAVDKNFNLEYFYYYYGGNTHGAVGDNVKGWRNYTFNRYDSATNSCTIIYDNKDNSTHDICSYMVPFIAQEGDFILWSQNAESSWKVSETGINPAGKTEATQNLSKFGTADIDIKAFAGWGDFMDYAWKIDISDHIFVTTNRRQYTYQEVGSDGNKVTVSVENRVSYFVTKNKTQHSTNRGNYNKYSYTMTHPNLQKPRAIMIEREDPTPRFIVVNEDGYAGLVDNQGRLIKRLLAFPEPIKMAGYDRETKRLAGLTKTKCYYTTLVI